MKKSKNTKSLVVDLTSVNLNKSNEVELAIAKAKKVWNTDVTEIEKLLILTQR